MFRGAFLSLGAALLFISVPFVANANIVINEIAWMGTVVSSTDEWIEFHNDGDAGVSLEGWTLVSDDGQPDVALSGNISAGGYFLLERTNDETILGVTADMIYVGALGNDGETLRLKDGSGATIDTVNAGDGWPAGDNTTKHTMQRAGSGWITAKSTPKAANASVDVTPPPTPSPVASPSGNTPSPYIAPEFFPKIKSYAGDDRVVVAGSSVNFEGRAVGYNNEPLEGSSVRFAWNFGDGKIVDGKNVAHIFRYPGTYMVTLDVVSGGESANDSAVTEVRENPVRVSEFLSGNDGWIELVNPSNVDVSIELWSMENGVPNVNGVATKPYIFPKRTTIRKGAVVVYATIDTGLTIGVSNPSIILRYPNGVVADTLSYQGIVSVGKSVARDTGGTGILSDPSPGKGGVTQETNRVLLSSVKPSTAPSVSVSSPVSQKITPPRDDVMEAADSSSATEAIREVPQTANSASAENPYVIYFIGSITAGIALGGIALFIRRRFFGEQS